MVGSCAATKRFETLVKDMTVKNPLQIVVAPHDQWTTKQPSVGADVVPSTPCRVLITGPSGSGKTQLVVDMLTRIYKSSFERLYVFSPSVHLDSVWDVVKHHVHTTMGVPETEQCFFDTWDEDKVSEILKTQRAVIEHQKKEKTSKRLYGICIVVDDFADAPSVMSSRAGGSALNQLLVRGRHSQISTMILSQRLRAAGPLIRVNVQSMIVFKLRNKLELESIILELSAVYDKKVLLEMYELATAERYSFWYINLAASNVSDMFYLRFEQRMIPSGASPNALQE